MMLKTKLSPIAVAVSMLIAVPTLSVAEDNQTSQTPQTDEQMTVLGKTYRNTATKTSLTPEETPQSISVIDRETLDLRGVNSVAELYAIRQGYILSCVAAQ